jgi:hypothetical protein
MATEQKKRPYAKAAVFGLMTVGLYAGVFAFADTIAAHFAQGSLWAAGPIATVFVFSYAHGNFTNNFWSCLGIEGRQKRKAVRATQPAQRPQVRAEVNA